MQTFTLRCKLWTSQPLEQTFAFFEDPYNLAKITPPWLNFRVTSPERVEMRAGAEIEYVIRWMSLPMRWKTLIAHYQPPEIFVDEQAAGPYRLWRHTHTFVAADGGTNVGDEVEYALPLGVLGRFAHSLFVRRQLLQIFRFRQEQIGRLLGGKTRQIAAPNISP